MFGSRLATIKVDMVRIDDYSSPLTIARRHRSLIITVFLVVFLLASCVAALLPTKYSSSMKILIRSSETDLIPKPERGDDGTLGQVSEAEVNSEVELLTNYDLLRTAVIKNDLSKSGGTGTVSQEAKIDTAVRKLGKTLEVTPVRKANIIEVEYAAKSPKLAADVLRTIEAGYLDSHLRSQSTPGGYEFFKSEVEHYQQQLTTAQQALADFSRKENIANLDQQRTLLTQSITDSENNLRETEVQIAQLTQEISDAAKLSRQVEPRITTAERSGPNQYSVDHLTSSLADLQNRRALLLSKFKDDDEFVKEVDVEIAQTSAALAEAKKNAMLERGSDVNPTLQTLQTALALKKVDLAGAKAKKAQLEIELSATHQQINHLADVAGQYDIFTTNVQRAREDYSDYSRREQQARVADQLDQNKITNVVIAQEPTESQIPVSSHLFVNLAVGFALALCASITAAFLAEYLKRSGQGALA